MNIQRFTGATSREALAKARMAFGDGTIILSNRPTPLGVEVMATTEDSIDGIGKAESPAEPPVLRTQARPAQPGAGSAGGTRPAPSEARQQVEDDANQLAMSTLSFQDYVRERMLRKRQTEAPARGDEAPRSSAASVPAPVVRTASSTTVAPRPAAASAPTTTPAPAITGTARNIMDELHAMRDLIEDRFNTFAWLGQARSHPIQSNLMLKLVRAGYSPALSRAILERMPETLAAGDAIHWMMEALERNLRTHTQALHDEGGVHALVGATGVGKTTTVAKLAGQCAQAHGQASVGVITLDTHRVGAHEQLRELARGLGLVAHLAHDRAALQDLLGLFANKRMVLIDTSGLAPRDARKGDAGDLLDLPGIKRLLVLNAGAQGDTLDDVVTAFKGGATQQTILSKVDEAVKLGPALDVAIRHQLVLRAVTTGQQVPQDLENADSAELVRMSMRSNARSAFDPKAADLGFLFLRPDEFGRAATDAMQA